VTRQTTSPTGAPSSGGDVHANPLAGDLVARGGIRRLDVACLGQHLIAIWLSGTGNLGYDPVVHLGYPNVNA
jgi:hypothetical protein